MKEVPVSTKRLDPDTEVIRFCPSFHFSNIPVSHVNGAIRNHIFYSLTCSVNALEQGFLETLEAK